MEKRDFRGEKRDKNGICGWNKGQLWVTLWCPSGGGRGHLRRGSGRGVRRRPGGRRGRRALHAVGKRERGHGDTHGDTGTPECWAGKGKCGGFLWEFWDFNGNFWDFYGDFNEIYLRFLWEFWGFLWEFFYFYGIFLMGILGDFYRNF